jgi:hypothetical protein
MYISIHVSPIVFIDIRLFGVVHRLMSIQDVYGYKQDSRLLLIRHVTRLSLNFISIVNKNNEKGVIFMLILKEFLFKLNKF